MQELTYTLVGDYYLPDLVLPEDSDERDVGVYGHRHAEYLKNHRKALYTQLLVSGKLHSYLADLNEQAHDRLWTIIEQMKATRGITEELKARDQIAWVGAVNNIKACAEEIVLDEMIYA
jgi:hypothetical protein